jgi:prevent-host-death family protein
MQCMSAREAKNSFGKLIDIARAEPVAIQKHGRAVVVVLSIESYEQLRSVLDVSTKASRVGHQSAKSLRASHRISRKISKQMEKE